jgi:hypothetical protein
MAVLGLIRNHSQSPATFVRVYSIGLFARTLARMVLMPKDEVANRKK